MKGEEGDTVTPVVSPVTLTVTELENPFTAVTETCATNAPPGETTAELGDAEMEKSAGGGSDDDPPPPVDELPPPQLLVKIERAVTASRTLARPTEPWLAQRGTPS